MRAAQLPPGSVVVDTSLKLDVGKARIIKGAGYAAVLRYLGLGGPSPIALDAAELAMLLGEGLLVGVVQFARTGQWSRATGASDGAEVATQMRALGIAGLCTPWLDFEADSFPGGSGVAIAYAGGWHTRAAPVGAGGRTGVYEGPGIPLTGEEWFHDLPQSHYWRSAADVPNIARRGVQMIQLWPSDINLGGGTIVDFDVVQEDYFGELPWWVAP